MGNSDDESKNLTADEAWELERYEHLLSLLLKDECFPDKFDLEELNEEDASQKNLKRLVQERNLLHKWIKEGRMREIKKHTSKIKSTYYLNDENKSAACTAIQKKKFKIYAYLLSIGASLTQYESNVIDDKLSNLEKDELRNIMLSYFPSSEKSHIYYIISKIRIKSQNSFDSYKENLFDYLEKLDKIKGVSIILKVIQYADNLNLVLDFDDENVKTVCPPVSKAVKGVTYHRQNTIYVAAGAKRSENQILGTMAHEFAHMAMELIFKNDCNPYFKMDDVKRAEFGNIAMKIEDDVESVNDTPSETLMTAYFDNVESELIVRVPHILAQYENGENWLEENVGELWKFYNDVVVPQCGEFIKNHFLSKPRSLNRYMNESEGEILNIQKSYLVFNNIDIVNDFQNSSKRIFALVTNYTSLGLIRILQGIYGRDYLEFRDRFLVFKLQSFIKNLNDIEYLFNSEATEILIIECPFIKLNEYKILQGIETVIKIVKKKKNKKIVFIVKEENNKILMEIVEKEKMNDFFLKEIDKDFSLLDLDIESRKEIFKKVISFQGKETRLGKLIENDENLLKCIKAGMIQELLNDKKIEVGSKAFGTSSLEGAYADIVQDINVNTLIYYMEMNWDIFIINPVGSIPENVIAERLRNDSNVFHVDDLSDYEHDAGNKRIILLNEEITDDNFKKFCGKISNRKIYLINAKIEQNDLMFKLVKYYNSDFYFARKFKYCRKIIMKEDILKEFSKRNVSEILLIAQDGESQKGSGSIQWENLSNAEREFHRLKKLNKKVHYLKKENDELIWVKSYGSLCKLRALIDEKSEEGVVDEDGLIKKIENEKAVIFADDPGMGKSTSLTKLYEIKNGLNSLVDTHWVIRINLKDHVKAIKNIGDDVNIKQITTFLLEIDPSLKNMLNKKLLESALDVNKNFYKPLLIVFDGFDELLDENDRNKIVILLKFLKDETKCKFWVTTRLHFKIYLEDELSTFAIGLVPVEDDTSKRKFIKKYLEDRLKLLFDKEKFEQVFEENGEMKEGSVLWKYATEFINKAKSIFKGDIERFIGTPLQLHLLLEDSFGSFRKYVENPIGCPDFPNLGNNLLEIYKGFFDRKYEIYFRKKNVEEEAQKSLIMGKFEKDHEELAKSLTLKKKPTDLTINSSILLIGITRSEGDHLEFAHFTFREYYFAQLLMNNLMDQQYCISIEDSVNFFKQEVLVKKEYQMIRSFINESFKNEKTTELLKSCREFRDFNSWFCKKETNSICGFCIAVTENHNDLLKFLFSVEFSNPEIYQLLIHKGLCNQRILHLAVPKRNDFALKLIIETASRYSFEEQCTLLKINHEYGQTVLHLAVAYKNDRALDEIIKMASKYGLNEQYKLLSIADELRRSALHLAIFCANEFALNRIIEIISKYSLDQQYKILSDACIIGTALHLAVIERNSQTLNKVMGMVLQYNLEEQYELLSIGNRFGETVLHSAVKEKNDFAFSRIIEAASKFSPDQQYKLLSFVDHYKETILHLAIREENEFALNVITGILSKYTFDQQCLLLSVVSVYEGTVFHLAVSKNDDGALDRIIKMASACSLNQQYKLLSVLNENDETVFHLAVRERDYALSRFIEMVSTYNSDQQYNFLSFIHKYGETVLHLAIREKSNDSHLNRVIDMASGLDIERQYQLLTIVSDDEGTLLHLGVAIKNNEALNWVIKMASKFSLDQQYELLRIVNHIGQTALHLAIRKKNEYAFNLITEMVSKYTLDQQFGLLSTASKYGGTVLHLAVREKNHSALNGIIEMASKFNANQQCQLLNIVTKYRGNLIDLAAEKNNHFALIQIDEWSKNIKEKLSFQ